MQNIKLTYSSNEVFDIITNKVNIDICHKASRRANEEILIIRNILFNVKNNMEHAKYKK
jgi:hypothetical protein